MSELKDRMLVWIDLGRAVVVEPDDDEALAGALNRLLADAGLRRRLGDAGTRRWRAYDWPIVARRFLSACFPEGARTAR